jgi:hypothetical protein
MLHASAGRLAPKLQQSEPDQRLSGSTSTSQSCAGSYLTNDERRRRDDARLAEPAGASGCVRNRPLPRDTRQSCTFRQSKTACSRGRLHLSSQSPHPSHKTADTRRLARLPAR